MALLVFRSFYKYFTQRLLNFAYNLLLAKWRFEGDYSILIAQDSQVNKVLMKDGFTFIELLG